VVVDAHIPPSRCGRSFTAFAAIAPVRSPVTITKRAAARDCNDAAGIYLHELRTGTSLGQIYTRPTLPAVPTGDHLVSCGYSISAWFACRVRSLIVDIGSSSSSSSSSSSNPHPLSPTPAPTSTAR
jgi:hypothetical protein